MVHAAGRLYLLMRNMNARMRRMSYRSEELDRQAEAEAAERRERKAGGKAGASLDEVDEVQQAGDGDAPQEQNGQTH